MTPLDSLLQVHRSMTFLDYLDLYCGDIFLASYWYNNWKETLNEAKA